MKFIEKLKKVYEIILDLKREQFSAANSKVLIGKLIASLNEQKEKLNSIHEVEFKVFSQWGDDGIIQYLISKLPLQNKTFVEFGVENYTESNTRFLLLNNNWAGLVIDGSEKNIKYIKEDSIYWQFELHAIHAFITVENIERLIDQAGFYNNIGILSIDIDGNDYEIWKSITKYKPDIVIIEYNAAFGDDKPWIVPYDPAFVRESTGYKKLFWGTSIASVCDLANEKGYDFIGCNLNGNNAYFVKRTINNDTFKPLTCKEGFVNARYREVYYDGKPINAIDKLKFLTGLHVFNTRTNQIETIH